MEQLGILNGALTLLTTAALIGLTLMRGTVTSLRARLDDYEKEVSEKDRRLTAVENENGQLRNDVAALGRVVTGEAHWTAIGETLDTHHAEATGHWERDEALLADILTELRGGSQ